MSLQLLVALTLFPLVMLFEVPIEKSVGVYALSGIYLCSFMLFIWGLLQAVVRKMWLILAWGIGMLSFWGYAWNQALSQNLFLGKTMASAYYAESPGYIELKIYEGGDCTIGYGGILGISDIFYCPYRIQDDVLLIETEETLAELKAYSPIKINGKEYSIGVE